MSCSPFDLRDYFLGELPEKDRREVEGHMRVCPACHEEVDRLRATQAVLLTVRDEEIPQRIGLISDKVFEPSPLKRWWSSSARLGFASAAMLSAALLAFTFYRPAPLAPLKTDTATVNEVRETEARDARRTAELIAAAEKRFAAQMEAAEKRHQLEMLNINERLLVFEKHYGVTMIASNRTER